MIRAVWQMSQRKNKVCDLNDCLPELFQNICCSTAGKSAGKQVNNKDVLWSGLLAEQAANTQGRILTVIRGKFGSLCVH